MRVERHPAGSAGFDALLPWLDDRLRNGRRGRLAAEYPRVVQADSGAVSCIVREDGAIRAHALLWPVQFRRADLRRPVGLVSWVVTDAAHRHRGLGRRVLEEVHAVAAHLRLDWTLLWTDQQRFFERLGYRPRGEERLLQLSPDVLAKLRAAETRNGMDPGPAIRVDRGISAAAVDFVERCRANRSCGVDGSSDAAGLWRNIPDLAVRIAWRGETPIAFAMAGRGDDLRGVVHEWGGEAMGLLACLDSFHDGPEEAPTTLLAPAGGECFIDRLLRAGARVDRQPLGWFHPVCGELPEPGAEPLFVWGLDSI